jgi:hypothetical protein
MIRVLFSLLAALLLGGCDQLSSKLGLEDPAAKEAKLEGEGKAVGSACRHSGRAIEDCYSIYSWLPKAAVYAGWREMDEYMRDNKIETIVPQLPPAEPPAGKKKKAAKPAAATPETGESAEVAPPADAKAPEAAASDDKKAGNSAAKH